jgi:hypothetical protein
MIYIYPRLAFQDLETGIYTDTVRARLGRIKARLVNGICSISGSYYAVIQHGW